MRQHAEMRTSHRVVSLCSGQGQRIGRPVVSREDELHTDECLLAGAEYAMLLLVLVLLLRRLYSLATA